MFLSQTLDIFACIVNINLSYSAEIGRGAKDMGLTEREREWGAKASRFIKAELKRADLGYKELAERLNRHGLEETETSITGKLARGTFATSFFLACLAVLERDAVRLEEI
jgi:Domain of unknown function (DUF6471)